MSNHSDFISKARSLMDQVVDIANKMTAFQGEMTYTDIVETLSDEDAVGENDSVAAADVIAALTALGTMIGGVSAEDKRKIYAIKH